MRVASSTSPRLPERRSSADARHQFAHAEGLGQVIVGADFETDDLVQPSLFA
jgi:hypothetical protein